ncbi:hypothetical protein [Amycolatopsis aidingensis]|uniref:hypothetical protein n=1 Tax=Amycolatopsis aidingensis TaxID=2842453 RepID=UPI001C0A9B3F|nr:hypothetical protein [Amycolatopsis aidingensis]
MTRMRTGRISLAVAAFALTAAACSGADQRAGSDDAGSVREFTEAAGKGLSLDYDPLASPRDAVRTADLVVSGTLAEVTDGIRFSGPAEQTAAFDDTYVTFVIEVEQVLAGTPGKSTTDTVHVAVSTGAGAGPERLSALNPQAKVVAVLDEVTTWRPGPRVTVQPPAGAETLYAAYTDGLWLQGGNDRQMYGISADRSALKPAWAGVDTVEEFAASLTRAAGDE